MDVARELDQKTFCDDWKRNEHWWDSKGFQETHTWGNLPGDESHKKLSQMAKTIEKELFYT